MRINRSSAVTPLAELKKNDTDLAKRLKVVASGQTLNSAGDGASNFAISERMRVRIRALGQDNDNVQTGMSMLRVAGGAVQEQINLMRTIKQKVIDANNDSNTDSDRETIQKEINQGYQQIQDIATDTTYNGRHLLLGGTYDRAVFSWEVKDHAVLVEGSDEMDLIPDDYGSLDGQKGPFALFHDGSTNDVNIDSLGLSSASTSSVTTNSIVGKRAVMGGIRRAPAGVTSPTYDFSGATDGKADTYTLDFSGYSNAKALSNVGFTIDGRQYVFKYDKNAYYGPNYGRTEVDISSASTLTKSLDNMVTAINNNYYTNDIFTAKRQNKTIVLTTVLKNAAQNNYTIAGFSQTGTKATGGTSYGALADAGATSFFSPAKYLSGGTNASGDPTGTDKDAPYHAATKASLSVNMSGVQAGQGITVPGYSTTRIRFVDGTKAFTQVDKDYPNGVTYEVGIKANSTMSTGKVDIKYNNGKLTVTARSAGASGNYLSVSDGFTGHAAGKTSGTSATTAIKAYTGSVKNAKTGKDGTNASYTFDLSGIPDTTSSADLENVIHDMRGKNIGYHYQYYYSGANNQWHSVNYEFIDSQDKRSLANAAHYRSTNYYDKASTVDLNSLRSKVASGTSIRDAVRQLLLDTYATVPSKDSTAKLKATTDKDGNVVLQSTNKGAEGNNEYLTANQTTLTYYNLDFKTWMDDNNVSNPSDLVGKGFRWYCATDSAQWFNVVFTDGGEEDADRPKSGTATQDIKTLSVDVSKAKNASDLVNAIYDQTMPILTGSDPNYNHNYSVAADTATGVLTIYDRRAGVNLHDTTRYPDAQTGAKIADGVLDNVVKSRKDLLVDDLVIQHTDKANKNIHLRLARTTLDHIFQFRTDAHDISEYNVMTKDMREKLLGYQADDTHKATQGLLDRGIEYLTDAEVLIGAQSNHLEHAHDAIVTDEESTTASDSAIRDADMAKEMTNYMRANILTQTASAMTAQANQSSKNVLELL